MRPRLFSRSPVYKTIFRSSVRISRPDIQENRNQRGTTAPARRISERQYRATCRGASRRTPQLDAQQTLVTKAEIDGRPLCRVAPQFERASDFLGCDGNADTIPRSQPAAETTHSYACTYCKYLLAFLDEG